MRRVKKTPALKFALYLDDNRAWIADNIAGNMLLTLAIAALAVLFQSVYAFPLGMLFWSSVLGFGLSHGAAVILLAWSRVRVRRAYGL